ncbi:1-phosphofructokinase [Treponema primitia]|uniref:1-phosphofructokinase n=1 Tax=Treponema primitia TaxID=88058 RepID=UPI0002555318|nr:1-phosphofructokinase [Treponema primitia]
MIITVSVNPALDKTARVDVMRPNSLNRLEDVRLDAGGKGVNVSAMIQALGGNSMAAGFAGGGAGDELLARIAGQGLAHDFVRIASVTRTNLKLVDKGGSLTELNEPGPEITAEEYETLEKKLLGFGTRGNFFVLSGSLPRGLQKDTYKKLCALLRKNGAAVFLDADGEALEKALTSIRTEVPNFIKPNRFELLKLFNMEDREASETVLIQLCKQLLERGVSLVCLSMGPEGALFISPQGTWKSPALPVKVQSSVGAGDSMVGALVYGFEKGLGAEACFALAMAASAGACTTEGTRPPARDLVNELLKQVELQKIN